MFCYFFFVGIAQFDSAPPHSTRGDSIFTSYMQRYHRNFSFSVGAAVGRTRCEDDARFHLFDLEAGACNMGAVAVGGRVGSTSNDANGTGRDGGMAGAAWSYLAS